MVGVVERGSLGVSSPGEKAQHLGGGIGILRPHVIAVLQELKARVIHHVWAENLRVAHLQRVFGLGFVICLGRQGGLLNSLILLDLLLELIADGQSVIGAELIVDAGGDISPGVGIRHRFGERHAGRESKGRIGHHGVDDIQIIDVPPLGVEEEGRFFGDRSPQIAVENLRLVTGLAGDERVARVQSGIGVIEKELAMIFVGAGFGKNFDSPIAQLVIFGGKRILIHANLADRGLRRKLTAGKSIDIDLASVGARGWTGERTQLGLQFVRIIGEGLEVLPLDDKGAGIFRRTHRHGIGLRLHRNLLLLHLNAQRDVKLLHLAGVYLHVGFVILRKALAQGADGVTAG